MAENNISDVALVGAGIMSATLGTLLKKLDPSLSIKVFERLDRAATESSDAWNNAGTGHAALCELNYTAEAEDGSIDISKAMGIFESFEQSKQFWSSLVELGLITEPTSFIRRVPHMSFVHGKDNVRFLENRFSTDHEVLRSWAPLIMQGRGSDETVAATRMAIGNDVNFGKLTRTLLEELAGKPNVSKHFGQEVVDFRHKDDGIWRIKIKDLDSGEERIERARFVFIGAGGGALELLNQK